MIPGTGPGRGVPWWRQVTALTGRPDGVLPEPVQPSGKREGRTVVALPRR